MRIEYRNINKLAHDATYTKVPEKRARLWRDETDMCVRETDVGFVDRNSVPHLPRAVLLGSNTSELADSSSYNCARYKTLTVSRRALGPYFLSTTRDPGFLKR